MACRQSNLVGAMLLPVTVKYSTLAFKNADAGRSGVLVADEFHHILDGFGCKLSATEFASLWNKYSNSDRSGINYSEFLKFIFLRQKGDSGIDPGWYTSRPTSSLARGRSTSKSLSMTHSSSGNISGYKSYNLLRERSKKVGKAVKKKELDDMITEEEDTIHRWFDDSTGIDNLKQWENRQGRKNSSAKKVEKNHSPGMQIALELRPRLLECWGEIKKEMKGLDHSRNGSITTAQLRNLLVRHGIALTNEDLIQLSRAFPVQSGDRSRVHYNNLLRASLAR